MYTRIPLHTPLDLHTHILTHTTPTGTHPLTYTHTPTCTHPLTHTPTGTPHPRAYTHTPICTHPYTYTHGSYMHTPCTRAHPLHARNLAHTTYTHSIPSHLTHPLHTPSHLHTPHTPTHTPSHLHTYTRTPPCTYPCTYTRIIRAHILVPTRTSPACTTCLQAPTQPVVTAAWPGCIHRLQLECSIPLVGGQVLWSLPWLVKDGWGHCPTALVWIPRTACPDKGAPHPP